MVSRWNGGKHESDCEGFDGAGWILEDDRGHVLWTYSYSAARDYQDANGAVYDATENRWIN